MQVAVVSDIHANRHALEAVLDDAAAHGCGQLWCLGDVVGYGAEPNACCAVVERESVLSLAGNHDLAAIGSVPTDTFSRGAELAAVWTGEVLEEPRAAWLRTLSPTARVQGLALDHASPRDPVWEYVLDPLMAELCFQGMDERIGLIGHSHIALSFVGRDGQAATGQARRPGESVDLTRCRWLLNPGSVGQPRDGDPRASWLELDLGLGTATWRRTRYDVAGAQAAIRHARLPPSLADRLAHGQ